MSPRRLGANGNVRTRPTSKVYTYIEKTYNLYINRRRHGVPSLSVLSMSFAFGSNGELWRAPDGQESSGAGTSEGCGEYVLSFFMAPQDAALGEVQLLCGSSAS